MMKKIYCAAFITLIGCSDSDHPGFERIADSVHFQLHAVGDEDRTISETSFISLDIKVFDQEDRMLAKKRIKRMESTKVFIPKRLKSLFFGASEGDSMTVVGHAVELEASQWFAPVRFELDTQLISVRLKISEVQSAEEILQLRSEERLVEDRELKELVNWKNAIDSLDFDESHLIDGIYFKVLKSGKGPRPQPGTEVIAHYKTWLCNGLLVDDTYKGQALEYVVGKPDQVLPGFAVAISHMRQGDKALCGIPAGLAYAHRGSSSGIVPPHAALIYEIDLVKAGN